jgi:hypothetical protein
LISRNPFNVVGELGDHFPVMTAQYFDLATFVWFTDLDCHSFPFQRLGASISVKERLGTSGHLEINSNWLPVTTFQELDPPSSRMIADRRCLVSEPLLLSLVAVFS